jgi:hypothetical protein
MTLAHTWRPESPVNGATPWVRTPEGIRQRLNAEYERDGQPLLAELPRMRPLLEVHIGRHDVIVRDLEQLGCRVTWLPNFPTAHCTWCDTNPIGKTAFRVIGAPADDDPHNPLIDEDVCRDCVTAAAKQAATEAVGQVQIEVAA